MRDIVIKMQHDKKKPKKLMCVSNSMDISVVIPFLNEEPNLQPLCEELQAALEPTKKVFELVFVDDGSTDDGVDLLKTLSKDIPQIRIVQLRRNFGQTAAMAAGLDHASGEVVVTIDADRQNDPADIPAMIEKLEEGYDLVCGWRHDRQDAAIMRKLPSKIANRLIAKTTGVVLNDYGCTLKAMTKHVAKSITLYGEMHRFIPAVASAIGVKIAEVKVNHRARVAGESKYGISRTFRVILDLVTVKFLLEYSSRPIHFFGMPGLALTSLGGLSLTYLILGKLLFGMSLSDRPLLVLSILLLILGVQFILFGLIGEMQTRIYHESQDKPVYYIREKIGWTEEKASSKKTTVKKASPAKTLTATTAKAKTKKA
jgi:glycosyltransferase involved in cell wall biosynthesis